MYQVIGDTEYSLNEQMNLPENARFSDVVKYWGNKLSPEEQENYFEFFFHIKSVDKVSRWTDACVS